MRAYLYISELAALTPWSESVIRTMMARGVLRLGIHYFKPPGPRSRPIFKWAAIVEMIEAGTGDAEATGETIRLANGAVVDLDEATAKIHAMRG